MNFMAHFMFGLFSGLITYQISHNWTVAFIMLGVQIALILDFLFKKIIHFEPLHTLLAMLLVWMGSFFFFPAYHWYVLLAYFTHLFLDIFVYEKIPLLFPFKQALMYPIDGSEKFVIVISGVGSLLLLMILFL